MKKRSWERGIFTGPVLLALLLTFLSSALSAGTEKDAASGAKLLLRVHPSSDAPILCALPAGTSPVLLPGDHFLWAEVLLPETVFVWVPQSGIRGEGVLAPGTPVRTGPGAFYLLAGRAKGGEKVRLFEKSPGGFWRKVRPLKPFLSCWCLRSERAANTANKGEKVSGEPGGGRLFEERAVVEGILFLLPEKERKKGVSCFALVLFAGKSHYVRTYLQGEESALARWKGRCVKITGKRFWNEGLFRPVLAVEKIEPGWEDV